MRHSMRTSLNQWSRLCPPNLYNNASTSRLHLTALVQVTSHRHLQVNSARQHRWVQANSISHCPNSQSKSSIPTMSTMSSQSQPVDLTGSCFCGNLTYQLYLDSKGDARTSLCHCRNCKKAFGGAFGLTSKAPLKGFRYAEGSGEPTVCLHFGTVNHETYTKMDR